jgi:hypothetical protein
MDVDPTKWPITAEFLRVHELLIGARGMPTLSWAYGSMLDRNEAARIPKLVAMSIRRARVHMRAS